MNTGSAGEHRWAHLITDAGRNNRQAIFHLHSAYCAIAGPLIKLHLPRVTARRGGECQTRRAILNDWTLITPNTCCQVITISPSSGPSQTPSFQDHCLWLIYIRSFTTGGDGFRMGSSAGSEPPCLLGFDTVISDLKWSSWLTAKGEGKFDVNDGMRTSAYRQCTSRWPGRKGHFLELFQQQGFVLGMFAALEETDRRRAQGHIESFFERQALFFHFLFCFFSTIELFCLSFHYRLGETWRPVCIQIINLDLSLEGERLICYVLKTLFDFFLLCPFPFFLSKMERHACFVSPVSLAQTHWPLTRPVGNLWPRRPQQPLIIWAEGLTVHHGS